MNAQPKNPDRKSFIEILEKNNVNQDTIDRFKALPETIVEGDSTYKLNVVMTYYSGGKSYYNYELNYYCVDTLEFLLTYKIFSNVEISINHLECELKARDLVDVACREG